ncbi:MAG: decaprenyl-phosphate phosphoribosyltransferase [Candidatus Magasanikbacteria bacterium]|nr:decaprenyl-phosphate phosphoribosyltransferase [Candidatus Magasanikbacteria bacterium]
MKNVISLLRPKQWVKNLFVFAALVFVREFTDIAKVKIVIMAFISWCAVASAVYIVNDIKDLPADRQHPEKRFRPLPSGQIGVRAALITALLLLIGGLAFAYFLEPKFALTIGAYFALMFLYTFILKQQVILDVITIALGFVLRVVSGAVVIAVSFSPWLVFCTFFLMLFLGISKRKTEFRVLGPASATRPVLSAYSLPLLDQMTMVALPLTLMTYTLYTFFSEHSRLIMITVPIVMYGLFRYLFITQNKQTDNDGPTDDVFSDRPLQMTVIVWLLFSMAIVLWQG